MGMGLLTFTAMMSVLPLLLGWGMAGDVQVRSITVEDQIILRVPVRPPPPQVDWIPHKGPKCISVKKIKGAFLSGDDHVDFILEGRKLLRASLEENCPALDFYEGFYLSSNDEKVCARRDVVRSRMGGSCWIGASVAIRNLRRRRIASGHDAENRGRLMQAMEFSQLFLRLAPPARQFINGSTLRCEAGIRWG
jgi:hypothetical protein